MILEPINTGKNWCITMATVSSSICLLPNIFCWGFQWNNDCTKCKLSAWHLIFKHCSLSEALVSKAIWAAHDSAWQRPPAEHPLSYMFIFSLTKKKKKRSPLSTMCWRLKTQQIQAEILVNHGEGQGALLHASQAFVSSPESSWLRILELLHHEAEGLL